MWRVARRHPGISTVSTVASVLVLSIAAYAYNQVRNERDQAREATKSAVAERMRTEAAERNTRAAMRTELWRHAALVRLTSTPDRRSTGLELLKKAAAVEPALTLKARLRDEAAEFLVLRGVERLVEAADRLDPRSGARRRERRGCRSSPATARNSPSGT